MQLGSLHTLATDHCLRGLEFSLIGSCVHPKRREMTLDGLTAKPGLHGHTGSLSQTGALLLPLGALDNRIGGKAPAHLPCGYHLSDRVSSD